MKLENLISRRPLQTLALGLALLGLQSCEYIKPVVIPAKDGGAPLAVGTLFDPETGDFYGGEGDIYYTDDLDESFYFILSGFDSGGARRLSWCGDWEINGWEGGGPCGSKWQTGYPGDVVDNGMWEPFHFKLSNLNYGTAPPESLKFRFEVEAMDFHGNISRTSTPWIVYKK
ncbi:MAG: hypothetical protein ACYTFV_05065 [Planctomycetota bacterium]|jgi:hypothetical protein